MSRRVVSRLLALATAWMAAVAAIAPTATRIAGPGDGYRAPEEGNAPSRHSRSLRALWKRWITNRGATADSKEFTERHNTYLHRTGLPAFDTYPAG